MKKQIILVLGLLIAGALPAQEKGSYINLNMGGGYHNLAYSLLNGTENEKIGYTLDAGYSYFFTPHWGIHTGLGIQSFNSLSTLNFLSNTPDVDTDGQSYDFKANYTNFQEQQQAILIDIPLALQYRYPIGAKFALQASVGAKVALPVQSTFKTAGGQLVTTGYYSQWNVELSDMPQHGFSTIIRTFSGNTSLKPAYMGIADLGGLVKLSQRLDLYVGGYVNYGLNNVLTPDSKLIYQPNGTYNGMLASTQINRVTPIAFGVKVGVYFHLGKHTPLNDSDNSGKSIESIPSKEQLNVKDSSDTTSRANSKAVGKEKVVQQPSTNGTRQTNASNLSNQPVHAGKPVTVLPVSSLNSGGRHSSVQPKTTSGTTGKMNQVQPADSLKTTGSVNSKTVGISERTANQPSNGTRLNNASSRLNLPVPAVKPVTVLPVPSLNSGGRNSTVQPKTPTGTTGKLNQVQPADSLKTTGPVNSKTVAMNERTAKQPSNGTRLNNASNLSNQPVPAVKPVTVLPVSSLNGGGRNSTAQPKTPTGTTGKLNQVQPADSLKTTGSVNSKTVGINERTANQSSNGTRQNNASGRLNLPVPAGKPVTVLPVPSLNSGGRNSTAQPKTTTGTTGKMNQVQPADSLKTTGPVNSNTVGINERTANQPSNGTRLNNASGRLNLPVPAGKPVTVLPVPSLNSGGKNSTLQPKTTTGTTGKMNQVQPADSLKTTGPVNSNTVGINERTANQPSNGTRLNNASGRLNLPVHTGKPVTVLQVPSLNSGGRNSTLQPETTSGTTGRLHQVQNTDSLGTTNSVNPENIAVNEDGATHAPKGIFGFFKSIFSGSSHTKGKLNQGQPIDPTHQTDSVGTTNPANSTTVAMKQGNPKRNPKGIRKYIKNILSKPSGQKGKDNSTRSSVSFDPSGSINSVRLADSQHNNGRFNAGQVTSPFERAKKIASSMSQWFEFDSYEITNANNLNAKELSDILKANPDILLVFVGYTCNIGTQVTNIKLGMKRVESVIQKFLDQGVPESQLIGESKGYDQPLVPNTSAENRALNRRVEIKVIRDN